MSKSKIDRPSYVSRLPSKDALSILGILVDDSALADNFVLVYDTASGTLKYEAQAAGGSDPDAIHDNVAGEIAAVTEKGTPVSADLVIIEDSADSNNKKRAQVGNLPGGGSGDVVGPAGATDHAIVRFDTATGKLVQNSGVIVDDANSVTGITQLQVDNLNLNGNTILATDVNGNLLLLSDSGGNVQIGGGTEIKHLADLISLNPGLNIDVVLRFVGTSNTGNITWMEDEARFDFDSPINVAEIWNTASNLKIQPDVQGDVTLFEDTDVGDADVGKSLYVYRKAAEGDNYLKFYISAAQAAFVYTLTNLVIQNSAAAGKYLRLAAGGHIYLDLGDTAGAYDVKIRDSGAAEVAAIDSNGNAVFNGSVSVDTIAEKTGAAGVTIDGVLLKDGTIGIGYGGTGQTTRQAAIDALTNVSGATNEHVLTKDTGTGNAVFKAAAGGGIDEATAIAYAVAL